MGKKKKVDTMGKISGLVISLEVEYDKFKNGNKTAGTRARKLLQEIKIASQDLRVAIQTEKNSQHMVLVHNVGASYHLRQGFT